MLPEARSASRQPTRKRAGQPTLIRLWAARQLAALLLAGPLMGTLMMATLLMLTLLDAAPVQAASPAAAATTAATAAATTAGTADTPAAGPSAAPTPGRGPGDGPDNQAAVERILSRVASQASHETGFVELRYLRFLDEPVESSGRLAYQPPNRLERRTEKPRPEVLVLDGQTLSMTRDGRTRSLDVSQLPAVGALVGSIRDLLAGEVAPLQRRYRTIAQGDDANWQLVLLPADPDLASLVIRIVVAGQADRIATIEILQADGDRSVMTLKPS